MNILLAETNTGNLILIIILLVACAGMFILSYFKNKKYMASQQDLLNNVKVGSKVLTKTFIYGTVEKITDTTDGKIVLIKTGEGDKVSYLEMNLEAIYSIDNKEEVVDVDEVIEENSSKETTKDDATEAFKVEEKVEIEKSKDATEKPKETTKKPVKKETKKTTKK